MSLVSHAMDGLVKNIKTGSLKVKPRRGEEYSYLLNHRHDGTHAMQQVTCF